MTGDSAGSAGSAGSAVSGLVTFRLGTREYATPLAAVREVVRLHGLHDLPGMAPPLAGVLELRGTALPVLDLRAGPGGPGRGDVLVLDGTRDGSSIGVAVDQVRAVVGTGELVDAGAGAADGVLPPYVRGVLRGPDGVVFLVELAAMADSARLPAVAQT